MGGPGSGRSRRHGGASNAARRLLDLRAERGISQSRLAVELGLAPYRLSRLLAGARPSLGEAVSIEDATGVPVRAWLT